MAAITLQKLNKHYGSVFHAVKDVDLEIADKEFVALVGPSGCGKSTTLRMIAGLEDITSGDIRIGDRLVNNLPPRDRDIAMVFQNYALYQHMSVYDNLAFGLRNKKTAESEIKSAIDRAAGMLGLHDLLQRKPKQLSGGQQQRVALGRCIVRNPQVFLFDEPLSNLDAELRVHMRIEIARLHRELQTTIIYVTHDQVEAMTLADKIVVLRDGEVAQAGSPLAVYDDPDNLFVAGFIGSPQMNFLPGVTWPTAVPCDCPPMGSDDRTRQRQGRAQRRHPRDRRSPTRPVHPQRHGATRSRGRDGRAPRRRTYIYARHGRGELITVAMHDGRALKAATASRRGSIRRRRYCSTRRASASGRPGAEAPPQSVISMM